MFSPLKEMVKKNGNDVMEVLVIAMVGGNHFTICKYIKSTPLGLP